MISQNYIKAPAVDNLNHLKNIIHSLEFTPIPYSYIDKRHLDDLQDKGKISKKIYNEIDIWKKKIGIPQAKGLIQSMLSILRSLDIITNLKIGKHELEHPLGVSGPILNTFLTKSVGAVKLTKIGYSLLTLLQQNDNKSINKYENILFWRFLISNITHNFQRLIETPASYNFSLTQVLEKYEMDSRSRNYFLNWINYFDLQGIELSDGGKILSKNKVIKKLISSVILELNTLEHSIYSIEYLEKLISQRLDLSSTMINFFNIFEIILIHSKSIKEYSSSIEGTTSSRYSLSLPHYPKINMLKIHGVIPLELISNNINNSEINSVLNLSDDK
jgi:hypothetical protein